MLLAKSLENLLWTHKVLPSIEDNAVRRGPDTLCLSHSETPPPLLLPEMPQDLFSEVPMQLK